MSGVHIHLLLNHAPVFGFIGAALVLAIGVLHRVEPVVRVGLGLIVLVALATIPVYLTGEPSEDAVEHLPGVGKPMIEEHEEAGEAALIAALITGAAALAALIARWRGWRRRALDIAALVLALLTVTVVARTAWLGGQIRHTEIRGGAQALQQGEEHEKD